MSQIRPWLTTRDARLAHDAHGRLMLHVPAEPAPIEVRPVSGFPLTEPAHLVFLLDQQGRELLCIDDLALLDTASRAAVELELGRRRFLPVIERIVRILGTTEPLQWTVATDRGETQFTLASEDDIHRLDGARLLIVDVDGQRYMIPDARALDGVSRRLLRRFL